jgi:hypothetical protein
MCSCTGETLDVDCGELQVTGAPHPVGSALVAEIERTGTADARSLSRRVSTDFLARNDTTREEVEAALERAVGGSSVERKPERATIIINDHRHSLNMGPQAKVEGSNVNVGGMQVNVSLNVEKTEVLSAIEALVRPGLSGEWNPDAARELADVIDQRGDVTVHEIRELTTRVGQEEKAGSGRVKAFLADVASNGLGGALGAGIAAGLGFLF